jgi:hypothetical protein
MWAPRLETRYKRTTIRPKYNQRVSNSKLLAMYMNPHVVNRLVQSVSTVPASVQTFSFLAVSAALPLKVASTMGSARPHVAVPSQSKDGKAIAHYERP